MKFLFPITISVLCLVCYSFKPTEVYPKGCYMSLDELKVKHPSIVCTLLVKSVFDDSDKVWIWAEDYHLVSKNKCLTAGEVQNKVFAYSNDTALYISLKAVKLYSGYSRVLTKGRYLAFYVNTPSPGIGSMFGFVGAAIEASMRANDSKKSLHVVDLNDGTRYVVDSSYIEKQLKSLPALHENFLTESNPNNYNTQIRYLQELNEQ